MACSENAAEIARRSLATYFLLLRTSTIKFACGFPDRSEPLNVPLARAGLYSLRHTAICMRIVRSDAQVNVFALARNAGTSVDQIERFYAARLPLSREVVRNLQLDMAKVAHEQERIERAHIERKRHQLHDALQCFGTKRLVKGKQKGRGEISD